MGYFTYIADQAFKTGEHGEMLFFLGGPWSKPLVIADYQKDATYRRHLWMRRLFFGGAGLGCAYAWRLKSQTPVKNEQRIRQK